MVIKLLRTKNCIHVGTSSSHFLPTIPTVNVRSIFVNGKFLSVTIFKSQNANLAIPVCYNVTPIKVVSTQYSVVAATWYINAKPTFRIFDPSTVTILSTSATPRWQPPSLILNLCDAWKHAQPIHYPPALYFTQSVRIISRWVANSRTAVTNNDFILILYRLIYMYYSKGRICWRDL